MRKLVFTTLLAILAIGINAQTTDDIKALIGKGQWDKAKEQVDKFLANEKNTKKGEGWYYKGVIYNELSKDEKYASLLGGVDGRMEAFNSFKKYTELEPKNILMTLEQNVRLFDIYNGYFDRGAKGFNSKNYDLAYTNFKNASYVEEYIAGKGYEYNNFSFPKMDTSLIQNIALSALLAKKEDDAAEYYKKLADSKITGEGYLEIYQFLVDYYGKKNDMVSRDKYAAIGRELYPKNEYWCEIELKGLENDKPKLFAKYDELIAGNCNGYATHFNYSAELFNYLYTQEKRPDDFNAVQTKLETVLKKTLAVQQTPEANLLLARSYFNMVYDIQDAQVAVKGTKPDDVKKRNDLKGQVNAKLDQMLPYASAAYAFYDTKTGSLKQSEKANFKVATNLMLNYYDIKGLQDKVKQYQDKLKAIDTL